MQHIDRKYVVTYFSVAILAFALISFFHQKQLYDNLYDSARDLNYYTHSLWNLVHGNGLRQTIGYRAPHLFAEHLSLIHPLLAPIYAVWPHPYALFILQALVLPLAAVALYHLARGYGITQISALALSALFLVYPSVHGAASGYNSCGYHSDVWFPLAFFLAYDGYIRKRALQFWVAFIFSLAVAEQYAMVWFGVGTYWIFKRDWRRGIPVTLIAAWWFLVATLVIIPAFSNGAPPHYFRDMNEFNVPAWTEAAKLGAYYYFKTGAFFALLSFFSLLCLFALPILFVYMKAHTSGYIVPLQILAWHSLSIISIMGVSAVIGLRRLELRWPRFRKFYPLAMLVVATGNLAISAHYVYGQKAPPLDADKRFALERANEMIPADAVVSASPYVATHFSTRKTTYYFPKIADAEYVLIELNQRWGYDDEDAVKAIETNRDFELVSGNKGILIYKRRSSRIPVTKPR